MIDNIDGMGIVHVRWIVKGNYPYKISINSNKGGVVEKSIQSGG